MSNKYEVKNVDDILKIPDIKVAMNLLKDWGLDTKGLRNKDEMINRLMDFWKNNNGKIEKKPKPFHDGLKESLKTDQQSRNKLRDKYDQLTDYLKKLPPHFMQDLNNVFPGLADTIQQRRREITSPDCTILVTGEKSSGKSTFINLLLETNIMPTSPLKCTTTFVELRYCSPDERPQATINFKPMDGERRRPQPEVIDLSRPENLEKVQSYMKRDSEGESDIEKIEIKYPFPNLVEGIVIVDSPGVGENRQMNKMIENYLTKSFGFIYLINTANAGGVQKGRLRDLLRSVVNMSEDDFTPKSTLFIGNKWDQVPSSDKKDVSESTFKKLSQIYPGIRMDQIYFMSITEALKAKKFGDMTEPHRELMEGVERLLPNSLRNKLNIHYRFISQVVKRSLYSVKVSKVLAVKGMESDQDMMKKLEVRMRKLETEAKTNIEDLRIGIEREADSLYKGVANILRSRQFSERVFQWREVDCPRVEKDWSRVASEAYEKISGRVSYEIGRWETENKIVFTIKENIIKKFKRDFELMEDQIRQIESAMVDGETKVVSDLHKSMKKQAPVKQLWKKAKKNDEESVKGLGGIVSSTGSLGSDRETKNLLKGYKKENCVDIMCKATEIFISSLFGDDLKFKLKRYLNRFVKGIDSIAKMIPGFIRADMQLMETLRSQMKTTKEDLTDTYPVLMRHASLLQGQLDLFYMYNIMDMDYRLRDLNYGPGDRIGEGSFAYVYRGRLKVNGKETTVALKISKDPVRENNITDILLEDRTLRELRHDNVVHYYGSVCREEGASRSGSKVYWIMIMEYCSNTLKSFFLDSKFQNPAKLPDYAMQVGSMETMADFVVQICEGLEYIHSKGLVHRDLKLENILVTADKVVKHADVGLTKKQEDIGGSYVGSPVYMAPEVLLQSGIYDRKADIYSMGIIVWEIWYGLDAADHIASQLFGTLEQAVKQGLRPSMSMTEKMPEDWQSLVKCCWDYEPSKRPEAKDIKMFFKKFIGH